MTSKASWLWCEMTVRQVPFTQIDSPCFGLCDQSAASTMICLPKSVLMVSAMVPRY